MAVPYNKNSGKKMMCFELVQIRKNIKIKTHLFWGFKWKRESKSKMAMIIIT